MSLLISAGPPLSPDRTMLHCPLPSSPGSHARVSMHCYPIGCVIKSTHRGICSCSPIVNFLKFTFYYGMVTSVIFLIKNNLNRHIKHENPLSIYENETGNISIYIFPVSFSYIYIYIYIHMAQSRLMGYQRCGNTEKIKCSIILK